MEKAKTPAKRLDALLQSYSINSNKIFLRYANQMNDARIPFSDAFDALEFEGFGLRRSVILTSLRQVSTRGNSLPGIGGRYPELEYVAVTVIALRSLVAYFDSVGIRLPG